MFLLLFVKHLHLGSSFIKENFPLKIVEIVEPCQSAKCLILNKWKRM